ncbi:MAG: guanylate kinase [Chitinispirillia bacterium]|nr:guanylate kinase [Chitinispirillia bacterium]MCL2242521.1 guanylate kinase [Chitinispirillia bacterium]
MSNSAGGPRRGKILVFSAASGAGKNTLIDHLLASVPGLVYSVSATTRKPRPGEADGVNYFFLTVDEFERKVAEGEFAEWEKVHGNYYGTPRAFIETVLSGGEHIVMDIDVFGKAKFDEAYPEAVGVLIVPPSLDHLEKRLKARGADDAGTIRLRLDNARVEMDFAMAQGKYEHYIVNDDLEAAKDEVVRLVRTIIDE